MNKYKHLTAEERAQMAFDWRYKGFTQIEFLTEEQVDEILNLITEDDLVEIDTITEEQIEEASYSAKAARAGKDIGKPGKNFEKIAKKAGEKYGSAERGRKVAGAILAKLRSK